jgi:hypothetical protein
MAVAVAGATGCSSSDSGTLKLVTGEEDASATFAGVTNVAVNWVDSNNVSHSLAQTTWPASSINLGTIDESTTGMIEVLGTGDAGQNLVFGSVIPLQFGAFDGVTVPVFVQRVGDFARLPDAGAADIRTMPLLGVLGGRYVVIAGGADPSLAMTTQLYDLLTLQAFPSPPTFPVAPESMSLPGAGTGTVAYLITDAGASAYDLSDSDSGTLALPLGPEMQTAADLAGGATIATPDGTQYIVGGTRTTHDATAAILRIDTQGTPAWIALNTPRLGAAATWVEGLGLVVAGGSATGFGAELVGECQNVLNPNCPDTVANIGYPADPSIGAGAAALYTSPSATVVLAGGANPDLSDPGVRVLEPRCAPEVTDAGSVPNPACVPTVWAPISTPIGSAQAFGMPDQASAVVVGSEPLGGQTHVFLLTSAQATELPTRVPHTNARALASPIGIAGGFFLFGGAPEIESFAPPF